MYVLLFDVFKHLLLRKTDALKICRKSKFLGKKIQRNALALKSKNIQGIFGKIFILALLSSAAFCIQSHVSDLFQIFLFRRTKFSHFDRILIASSKHWLFLILKGLSMSETPASFFFSGRARDRSPQKLWILFLIKSS